MKPQFDSLFRYSSYRLMKHERRALDWGQGASFDIPGGRYLVIAPQELRDSKVSMKVMLLEGGRPLIDTSVALREPRCATSRRSEAAGRRPDHLDRRGYGVTMLEYVYDQAKQLIDTIREETRTNGIMPLLEPVAPVQPVAAAAAAGGGRGVDVAGLPLGDRDRRLRGALRARSSDCTCS